MTFDRLYKIFRDQFAIKGLTMEQIGKVVNLIGALYLGSKKKNPDLDMYDFIYDKILMSKVFEGDIFKWVKAPRGSLDEIVVPICLNLKYYFEECKFKPSTLGLTSSKEILKTINEIIDQRIPF